MEVGQFHTDLVAILAWSQAIAGSSVSANSVDTLEKKNSSEFYIPPDMHEGVSRDCVGKMRAATVQNDTSLRNCFYARAHKQGNIYETDS